MKNIKGFAKMSSVLFLFLAIVSIPFFTEYTEINADRQTVIKEDILFSRSSYDITFIDDSLVNRDGSIISTTFWYRTNKIPIINNNVLINQYWTILHFWQDNIYLGHFANPIGNLNSYWTDPDYIYLDYYNNVIPSNATHFQISTAKPFTYPDNELPQYTYEERQNLIVEYYQESDSYQVMENFRTNAVNTNYFGFITTIVTYGEVAISYVKGLVNFFTVDNFILEYLESNAFDIYEKWWFRPVRWLTE